MAKKQKPKNASQNLKNTFKQMGQKPKIASGRLKNIKKMFSLIHQV